MPWASQPEPLLIAAVPHLGDLAVDDAVHVHAADLCLIATLGHRRVVDDGDVLTVVPRDDKMEVPVQLVEHRQNFLDALADLRGGPGIPRPALMADHGVGDKFVRHIEVALVPYREVVQFNNFAGGAGGIAHSQTSQASMSFRLTRMVTAARWRGRW